MNDNMLKQLNLSLDEDTGEVDITKVSIPAEVHSRAIFATMERSVALGKEKEREELICRLLASEMPVDEISMLLCIRTDEIRLVESNNASTKIPDYKRTLKQRRRKKEKALVTG